jgi:hypothetical protein
VKEWPTDDMLIERARDAYFRQFGDRAAMPSKASKVIPKRGERFVELANAQGRLATFRYDAEKDRLEFLS